MNNPKARLISSTGDLVNRQVRRLLALSSSDMLNYLLVGADAGDAPSAQFYDLRAVSQCSEPVGDNDHRELVSQVFDGLHDGTFGFVVQGAGSFVEYDDIGAFV